MFMKERTISCLFVLLLALLGSCTRQQLPARLEDFGENEVRYARGFTLQRHNGVTRVAVRNPWDSLSALAVYYMVGNASVPVPADGQKVVVPIRRMVTTSTTHYEPIDLLHELGSVVAVCNPERTYNQQVRSAVAEGRVAGLGDNFNINREVLVGVRPEALLVSRYSATDQSLAAIENDGYLIVYNQEWQEQTLLGRAEWIKLVGALYGKEAMADSVFRATEKAYNELKDLVTNVEAKPKVMSGCGYHGTWYVPGGQSYMADLYRDAGASYAFNDDRQVGSLPLSLETVLTSFADADYWFGVQQGSMADVRSAEPRIASLKAVGSGLVFSFNRRRGPNESSDFWEGAISHPDLLLADVIAVLHPQLLPNHQFTYVEKVKE